MLPEEYGSVDQRLLEMVRKEMADKTINFQIDGVKVFHLAERSGRRFWLLSFKVSGGYLEVLRRKLGLKKTDKINYHMTVHEREIFTYE